MAARKKNEGAAQFTVVLEDMNAKFAVFGEALQGFRETMSVELQSVRAEIQSVRTEVQSVRAEMHTEFQSVRAEMHTEFQNVRAEMHTEFQSVRAETHTEVQSVRSEMHTGFDATDHKLDAVHRELSLVKTAVLENRREIRALQGGLHDVRGAVARVEVALEKKVDRDELSALLAR